MKRRDVLKQMAAFSAGAMALPSWLRAENAAPDSGPAFTDVTPPLGLFHNVQALERDVAGGWRMTRVPPPIRTKLNDNAQRRAYATAGVELRFALRSPEVRITLRSVENREARARHLPVLGEVHYGDFYAEWFQVGRDWTELVIRAPKDLGLMTRAGADGPTRFAPELIRVALPYLPEIQIGKIEGDLVPVQPGQVPRKRFLVYGSSITNGAYATRPAELYPARVARALGVDHFNLGLGGGAHLEYEIAEWIAERQDWDFAVLELGINLVTRISAEEFTTRVERFLSRVVKSYPDKWVFCIDLFTFKSDLSGDSKPALFRKIVRDTVQKLDAPRLVHCDGRHLLASATGLSLDFLHPSADGFAEIAEKLTAVIRARGAA